MRNLPCRTLLALVIIFGAGAGLRADDDSPLAIEPKETVDENLFLMRALETTYERWPRNTTHQATLEEWLGRTRQQMSRLRAHIKAKKLDPQVGQLYDECLQLLDTYETFLANLGAIDRGA